MRFALGARIHVCTLVCLLIPDPSRPDQQASINVGNWYDKCVSLLRNATLVSTLTFRPFSVNATIPRKSERKKEHRGLAKASTGDAACCMPCLCLPH